MALSPILNIPLLSTSQSAKEVTINTMVSYLERAMNDAVALNMANGNLALPATDFQRYMLFKITNGAPNSILTLPPTKRLFVIDNRGNANVLRVNIGADTKQLEADAVAILHSDGTAVTIVSNSAWAGYEDVMPSEEPNGRHTHWRIRFTDFAVANWIEATEIEFKDRPTGADLTGAGTPIASGTFGGSAAGAFDNSMTSYWMHNTTGDKWIGYTFAAPVAITSFVLSYRTAATYYGRGGVVEYSDDGTNWFEGWKFSGFTYQTGVVNVKTSTHPRYQRAYDHLKEMEDVLITGTPAQGQVLSYDSIQDKWVPTTLTEDESKKTHRLWRLFIVANGGGTQIELPEVEFRSVTGTPEQPTGGQAIAGNGTAANAFDGNTATSWSSTTINGNYIGYDFVSPKLVNEVLVRGPATVNRAPMSFRLEFSDDGQSWVVSSRVVDKNWATNEEMLLIVGATAQEIPDGGAQGQVLTKRTNGNADYTWMDSPIALPTGGVAGQVLTKTGPANGAAAWTDPPAPEGDNGHRGVWGGMPDILFNTMPNGWTFDRPGAAVVALPDPDAGTTNALKFADITDSEQTWGQFEVTMASAGSMAVRYQVSTEPSDRIYIAVDGVDQFNAGGVVGAWATATVALTAGNHIVRMRYVKDGSVSQGDDSVWLGKISFTETNAPVYQNGNTVDWNGALWLCLVDGATNEPTTSSTQWRKLTGSITSIDGLTDVDTSTTAPTLNQALIWNGTQWVPGEVATEPGATSLAQLTDVNMTTPPTNRQALVWDAATSKWIPGTVASGAGVTLTGEVVVERTWRYFRLAHLVAQDEAAIPSVAEIKFFSPSNVEVLPAVVSASSAAAGQPATLATDNNPDTYWAAIGVDPSFTADFGTPVSLGSITILSRNDAVGYVETPTHWVLYGSEDGIDFFELAAMRNPGYVGAGSTATAIIPETVKQYSVSMTGLVDLGLGQLNNVDLSTAPTNGQALVWNQAAGKWVPGTVSGGGGSTLLSINAQTANYSLVLADGGKLVRMSVASSNNLTVPANSNVAFPVGTVIHLRQAGAGQTTVVAASGVTVTTAETLKLRKAGSSASLIKVATDTWDLTGDLEAI